MLSSSGMYSRYVFECECNDEIPIDRRKVDHNGTDSVYSSGIDSGLSRRAFDSLGNPKIPRTIR